MGKKQSDVCELFCFFFFNDTATTEIYTLSLHDALPIFINDTAMNAFATGRDPEHAAVAVTAGLLGRLNRDELQGVIAHEISHILHRDILFVTLAGVALGRSEEHTSELQSHSFISYAVFCLKKKKTL